MTSAISQALDYAPGYIRAEEARGNSRPVTLAQFRALAAEGKAMLARRYANRSPIDALNARWTAIKATAYAAATQPWGGVTIDAHTGTALPPDADGYALSVKPSGMVTVSVPEDATAGQFSAAMDLARARYRTVLEHESFHLGVFHDDDNHRIDIDPVIVVATPQEVEAIGAYSHAVGGAYHFATGDGYFPPHVADLIAV